VGLLITFEGCEGCGKSTQVERLYARLQQQRVKTVIAREPGTTKLGDKIRALLKERDGVEISPLAELFLFLAARNQLVTEVLRHSRGREVVICDRYADSSVAYQGYGRGLDLAMIEKLNAFATEGHQPDLVVLLDIPPDVGLARKETAELDHFERIPVKKDGAQLVFAHFEKDTSLAFHQLVRRGYLEMAQKDPARWLVVDGTLPRKEAEVIIWRRVESLLARMPGSVV
jgi:dTMP kinase